MNEHLLVKNTDGSLLLTSKTTFADEFDEDENGFCTSDGVTAEITGNVVVN